MRKSWLGLALLATMILGGATLAWSETTPEVRPYVGAFVPTGEQRDILKNAVLVGGQLGVEIARSLHVLGTFGYVPDEGKALITSKKDVGIYQYDVGLEAFNVMPMNLDWEFRPFLGLGGGGRTYDPSVGKTQTNLAGYGAIGTEFQTGNFALRLEGRDYLTRFKGLDGKLDADVRSDLMLMLGAALHW